MAVEQNQSFLADLNQYSSVKHVIGVVSGKGGVGKSFVTSRLAVLFSKKGYRTAVLDADITGPSIPKCFGIEARATADEMGIEPVSTKGGIQVMSVNLLLNDEEAPVVWRGPVISGTVKQFWTDVHWDNVDYMFVDMPPGTGDVPLTVFQSLPVDGIIIVTSPQDLVSMIVAKAVNMADAMGIPVLGIVENYSFITCPDCGKKIFPFGEGRTDKVAAKFGLPVLASLPIDPVIANAMDQGSVEDLTDTYLSNTVGVIEAVIAEKPKKDDLNDPERRFKIAVPVNDKGNVDQHFAEAKEFALYETSGRQVVKRDAMNTEGFTPEKLADELRSEGVGVVISGGIKPESKEALTAAGLKLVPGVLGSAEDAVTKFLNNDLSYSDDKFDGENSK